jgi:hypothetical protein
MTQTDPVLDSYAVCHLTGPNRPDQEILLHYGDEAYQLDLESGSFYYCEGVSLFLEACSADGTICLSVDGSEGVITRARHRTRLADGGSGSPLVDAGFSSSSLSFQDLTWPGGCYPENEDGGVTLLWATIQLDGEVPYAPDEFPVVTVQIHAQLPFERCE